MLGNSNPFIWTDANSGVQIRDDGYVSTVSPTPSNLFIAKLSEDQTITVASPTAPLTFPAGQPVTLLSIERVFRGGRTLITGIFSASLRNDDPDEEYEPRLIFMLYLDGAQIPLAQASIIIYSNPAPANLQGINQPGAIETVIDDLEPGQHTIELRWGLQGQLPAVTGFCWPSSYDCATLKVQEI